jgi:serine/threonine-protein kinase ATR
MGYSHLTDQLIEELPPYMFLTAFSQLVSRICHPHPDVFRHLKTIIVYMLLVYPQQSLWMLMPVYKVCVLAAAEATKESWFW